MGIYVCGFLELSSLDEEMLTQDYAWQSCINLSSLSLNTGDECSILFGEAKDEISTKWVPLAHRRGLPTNPGELTAQAAREASATTSVWGFTFLCYEEMATIDWQAYPAAILDGSSYGWGLLSSLMKTLDEAGKHQRLVVWFDWS